MALSGELTTAFAGFLSIAFSALIYSMRANYEPTTELVEEAYESRSAPHPAVPTSSWGSSKLGRVASSFFGAPLQYGSPFSPGFNTQIPAVWSDHFGTAERHSEESSALYSRHRARLHRPRR